ncbi:branched-chain amino acid ABC transporter substrate-binding protein, partial [Burkholderia cepacia]|nr:branched-chain amino acid ABC transporter substrate-binding protein [Burkholderia cepacia]HEM7898003.1 branched-chain amino acid ABC transporter substrate-binding protein [Burkholderia cenocepacia]
MERSTVGMRCKPLITVALAAAAFAAASSAMADQVVKIGSVEPTTGGISHLGKDN